MTTRTSKISISFQLKFKENQIHQTRRPCCRGSKKSRLSPPPLPPGKILFPVTILVNLTYFTHPLCDDETFVHSDSDSRYITFAIEISLYNMGIYHALTGILGELCFCCRCSAFLEEAFKAYLEFFS